MRLSLVVSTDVGTFCPSCSWRPSDKRPYSLFAYFLLNGDTLTHCTWYWRKMKTFIVATTWNVSFIDSCASMLMLMMNVGCLPMMFHTLLSLFAVGWFMDGVFCCPPIDSIDYLCPFASPTV